MDVKQLNTSAIELADCYVSGSSSEVLCKLHFLLLPVTKQQIKIVIAKLHLGYDMLDDMEQEAFLKLRAVIFEFKSERSTSFVSWWRRVLANHLLSRYHSKRHAVPYISEPETKDRQNIEAREILTILKCDLEGSISKWRSQLDKQIACAIISERIFSISGKEKSQKELAQALGISQGFVSRWEVWLRKRLKESAQSLMQESKNPRKPKDSCNDPT